MFRIETALICYEWVHACRCHLSKPLFHSFGVYHTRSASILIYAEFGAGRALVTIIAKDLYKGTHTSSKLLSNFLGKGWPPSAVLTIMGILVTLLFGHFGLLPDGEHNSTEAVDGLDSCHI
jgi:hypothetical protein